jgi:HK97 family phage major capsid protein
MSLALKEQREAAETELRSIADALEAGTATDEQRSRATELTAQIEQVRKDEAVVEAAAALRAANPDTPVVDDAAIRSVALGGNAAAAAGTVTTREVSPYAKENRSASFFRDQIMASSRQANQSDREAAAERLERHFASEGDERSVQQVRAMATTGNGADLVAPAYLQDGFVNALGEVCTASSLVRTIPIDVDPLAHTTSVNVPTQIARVGIADHTENAALTESDVETSSVRVDISRGGGRATVPNFLLQRSLPGIDEIIMQDLADAAAEDLNDTVLTVDKTYSKGFLAESGLGSSTYTDGTPDAQGAYQAVLGAFADVLAGVKRGGATGVLMHSSYWFWLLGQLTADQRSYMGPVTPENAIGVFGNPDGVKPAGHILGVPVYLDQAIPVNLGDGTNETRIIVSKFDENWLLRGAPRFAVSEHAGFDNDQTKMRVTIDRGFTCARRKGATSIVSGTGLVVA